MTDYLIIAEHIGLNIPTVVYHNGERLETVGLDIQTLVDTWRKKWDYYDDEWLVLALSDKEYKALQHKTLPSIKTLQEIFYNNKVICINAKEIQEKYEQGESV